MADPVAPPAHDEVELSAFGPGYGESLLVHLGMGEWMIVDSCRKAGRLPALDYLEAMGVDLAQVTLIVATHWHDDHVRGIAQTLALCPRARFACSVALNHDELLAAIGRQPPGRFGKVTSGVDEMRDVLQHLDGAGELHRLLWAMQSLPLHQRGGQVPCRVLALSPCNVVIGQAHRRLAELIVDTTMLRVQKPERNEGAVVLWVEVGDATVLLGADLQETPEHHTGWTAVVDSLESLDRRSEVFKVPHHGSSNAHQPLVWSDLLVDNPEAVVCPHERGANKLPGPDDLDRLCGLAKVHLTAPPSAMASSIRRGHLGRVAVVDFGRVTLRRSAAEAADWAVTYAAPARYGCRD